MEPFTIILIAVAVLLGIGIIVLEWIRPAPKFRAPAPLPAQETARAETGFSPATETFPLEPRIKAAEFKIQMAHERIQRIENILTRIPVEELEKRLDWNGLQKKVERLIEFRNDVQIRVTALEDRHKSQPIEKRAKEKQLEALERELKEQDRSLRELETKIPQLVFNNKKRKR